LKVSPTGCRTAVTGVRKKVRGKSKRKEPRLSSGRGEIRIVMQGPMGERNLGGGDGK